MRVHQLGILAEALSRGWCLVEVDGVEGAQAARWRVTSGSKKNGRSGRTAVRAGWGGSRRLRCDRRGSSAARGTPEILNLAGLEVRNEGMMPRPCGSGCESRRRFARLRRGIEGGCETVRAVTEDALMRRALARWAGVAVRDRVRHVQPVDVGLVDVDVEHAGDGIEGAAAHSPRLVSGVSGLREGCGVEVTVWMVRNWARANSRPREMFVRSASWMARRLSGAGGWEGGWARRLPGLEGGTGLSSTGRLVPRVRSSTKVSPILVSCTATSAAPLDGDVPGWARAIVVVPDVVVDGW